MTICPACNGLFDSVYDEPREETGVTPSGRLYVDASDWTQWHYIDLKTVADAVAVNTDYNPSSAWTTEAIPLEELAGGDASACGIYTYWYDVFGAGISNREFRTKYATAPQPEPDNWTIAVHRNNVRTNGAMVAATDYRSIDDLPEDAAFIESLDFRADCWNESDVWVIQDQMLLGLIGNQGIMINPVLSQWLTIDIPPMPPAFTLHDNVFVIRCADGTYGALQLENYQSQTGTKCCLTINYKYPINI